MQRYCFFSIYARKNVFIPIVRMDCPKNVRFLRFRTENEREVSIGCLSGVDRQSIGSLSTVGKLPIFKILCCEDNSETADEDTNESELKAEKREKLRFFAFFFHKNLVNPKKSSNFAAGFRVKPKLTVLTTTIKQAKNGNKDSFGSSWS